MGINSGKATWTKKRNKKLDSSNPGVVRESSETHSPWWVWSSNLNFSAASSLQWVTRWG